MDKTPTHTCLQASAPIGFLLVRVPDLTIVQWNSRFEDMVNCRFQAGQNLKEALPEQNALFESLEQATGIGVSFCLPDYPIGPELSVEVRLEPCAGGAMILLDDHVDDKHDHIQTQLSLALESARSGVWWIDLKQRRVYASKETAKIYGRDAIDEDLDKGIAEMVDPRDQAAIVEKISQSAATREPFHAEFRILRADGSTGWSHARGRVQCNANGQAVRLLGVQSDITDQKLIAQKLEVETAKLETIFRNSPAMMALWRGPDLVFEKYNIMFQQTFEGRELDNKTFAEAFPDLKGQPFECLLRQVYETGQPFQAREMKASLRLKPNGKPEDRYYDFTYAPIKDAEGKPYGVYDHCLDVTDRVLGQERLRQIESRLRKAVTVAKVGFFDWNIIDDTLTLSTQMKQDWGVRHVEKIGDALAIIHPDDRRVVEQKIQSCMETQAPYFARYRVIQPETGTVKWIEAQGEVSFNRRGQAIRFFGTSVDISEQKANEHALQEARLEAERANSAKSTFLANMSHEIRSPLGAIMGFAEILRGGKASQDEVAHFVAAIDRNSQHLLRIIDDILDLSKVEAGKMLVENIEFPLPDLFSDIADLMGLKARDKGIDFHLVIHDSIPDAVIADPTRIRQIISNILGNAIKFTERGRVQLEVTYEKPMLEFRVTDTGPGISPEQAQKLFQPFHQADVSTTRKFGGTGLGLILTRRLTEAMGGSFELESSRLGWGSTFVARVRVAVPEYAHMIAPKDLTAGTRQTPVPVTDNRLLYQLRILVVEDSPDNQFLFEHVLTAAGAYVDIAQDGYEGLHMALINRYDLILMDVQMPRMDGHEATKTLRRKGVRLPIIALTAHAMKEEKQRSLLAGFTDFLSKPVPRDALIAMILRYGKKPRFRTGGEPYRHSPEPSA